jgi:hypothetical protein
LSLRQLAIIMVFFGIAYSIYTSLAELWQEIAIIVAAIPVILWITIATLKVSEMTFMQLVLAFIRYKVNLEERKWIKWVDSFWPLDVGYIVTEDKKQENKVDFDDKLNKMKELDEKLEKI